MRRQLRIGIAVLALALPLRAGAQEPVDERAVAAFKVEGFQRSQVMETLSWLTDVYGPRLTNSPGYRAAAEWVRSRAEQWGLANAHLEPWGTFGPGWSVDRFSVEMLAPSYNRLIAYPMAWTPSTPGVVRGTPIPIQITSPADFAGYRGKLRNAIVMLGVPAPPELPFTAPASRLSEDRLQSVRELLHPGQPESYQQGIAEFRRYQDQYRAILKFLKDEGVAVVLEPSSRAGLLVEVASFGYYLGNTEPLLPSFVIAQEHYGRMLRMLDKGIPVTLEVSLTTSFQDRDLQGNDVIAEIPGTDPRLGKELVMLGGHLDSWHSGTGATDNAAGCAVAMEAMRILKAAGVKPRRTIRMALWDGEEQGYFGSIGYVRNHFGDPDTKVLKPEQALVSAYFNLDNGSGRIRGVNLQGNEAVRPIFEAWLRPFNYLGATTLTTRNTGGTDHEVFHAVGIPGFQFIQDPLDYGSRTHHSMLDVYESASADDLEQAAVIMASFVYHAAMREERLPRHDLPKPWTAPGREGR